MAILMIFSSHAIVDATKLTFAITDGRIYVETDEKHFGLYGKVTDKDGVQIIVVNSHRHHTLTSDCITKSEFTEDVNKDYLQDYSKMRMFSLNIHEPSPAISKVPTSQYSWSETFSFGEREFSVTRLDKDTVVYSSAYFPEVLARVIISGQVVIFVRYDGKITLKFKKCLYPNEKILVDAIKKINLDCGISSCFSPSEDHGLKKYLRTHRINKTDFSDEQDYIRPLTKEERRKFNAENRAIMNYFMGSGTRVFDGNWGQPVIR